MNQKSHSKTKEEVDQLVNDNIGLLITISKNFNPKNYTELENYISAGSLGIVRAALSYNPNLNVAFSTHATYCIRNEILNFIRYEKKHYHCISIVDCSYDMPESLLDTILPSTLTENEIQIVEMKKSGFSNKEIADTLDLTKAKLKIAIKKILTKIREGLE